MKQDLLPAWFRGQPDVFHDLALSPTAGCDGLKGRDGLGHELQS